VNFKRMFVATWLGLIVAGIAFAIGGCENNSYPRLPPIDCPECQECPVIEDCPELPDCPAIPVCEEDDDNDDDDDD